MTDTTAVVLALSRCTYRVVLTVFIGGQLLETSPIVRPSSVGAIVNLRQRLERTHLAWKEHDCTYQ
jgi:hypothetical protein